jgi:hypothetical protein
VKQLVPDIGEMRDEAVDERSINSSCVAAFLFLVFKHPSSFLLCSVTSDDLVPRVFLQVQYRFLPFFFSFISIRFLSLFFSVSSHLLGCFLFVTRHRSLVLPF